MASTKPLYHMHMRIKEWMKDWVDYPNATGSHYYMGGVYEKCWGPSSNVKRMNATWPTFKTIHICVGCQLIICFYIKPLQARSHKAIVPSQTIINISFWGCKNNWMSFYSFHESVALSMSSSYKHIQSRLLYHCDHTRTYGVLFPAQVYTGLHHPLSHRCLFFLFFFLVLFCFFKNF